MVSMKTFLTGKRRPKLVVSIALSFQVSKCERTLILAPWDLREIIPTITVGSNKKCGCDGHARQSREAIEK